MRNHKSTYVRKNRLIVDAREGRTKRKEEKIGGLCRILIAMMSRNPIERLKTKAMIMLR